MYRAQKLNRYKRLFTTHKMENKEEIKSNSSKSVTFNPQIDMIKETTSSNNLDQPNNLHVKFFNKYNVPFIDDTGRTDQAASQIRSFHPIQQVENQHFQTLNATASDLQDQNKIRIVMISDTHGQHNDMIIPDGDILIHCGDITMKGEVEGKKGLKNFAEWLGNLPHTHKIVIAGNHDLTLDENEGWYDQNYTRWGPKLNQADAIACLKTAGRASDNRKFIYLEDESVEVEGLKIYGSPYSAEFHDWAFNVLRDCHAEKLWSKIPTDTDILVTHGPPAGAGDRISNFYVKEGRCGDVHLMQQIIERIQPKIHCFGHIHEDYGVFYDGTTRFVNCSSCSLRYKPVQAPIVVDLDRPSSSSN